MARPPAIDTETALWLALNIRSLDLTDDQFCRFCRDNPDYRFEISAEHELIIMSPTGMKTGSRNSRITYRLAEWAEQDGTGVCCDSSTMFTLPNGAKRSPDGAWILKTRLDQFTEEEKDSLTKICPDFVVELRSKSDRLSKLKQKMEEYIANGARLGWLLDPLDNSASIYRPGRSAERIDEPDVIKGDPVLPGFRFDFKEIL